MQPAVEGAQWLASADDSGQEYPPSITYTGVQHVIVLHVQTNAGVSVHYHATWFTSVSCSKLVMTSF